MICNGSWKAGEQFRPQQFNRSFLKCSRNALNWTEDDILWQDDDADPFDEEAEVDDEGELYYAEQDEMSTVELDKNKYHCVFGSSDGKSDFEGF